RRRGAAAATGAGVQREAGEKRDYCQGGTPQKDGARTGKWLDNQNGSRHQDPHKPVRGGLAAVATLSIYSIVAAKAGADRGMPLAQWVKRTGVAFARFAGLRLGRRGQS